MAAIKLDRKAIQKLEPKEFWTNFYDISQIPRGSYNMVAISRFLRQRLEELGGTVREDKGKNLIATFPASLKGAKRPIITLHAHMDMVCQKEETSKHNFLKDPIQLMIQDEYVTANNTTLGGDDGYGLSAILSVLADKKLVHGPIQVIFSADEEVGLLGIMDFDGKGLKGKYLFTLDGAAWDEAVIGSAGVIGSQIYVPLSTSKINKSDYVEFLWKATELSSGHSGILIHLKKINAIKMMFDMLFQIKIITKSIFLVDLDGGKFTNSIPPSAEIKFLIPINKKARVESLIKKIMKEYAYEFEGYEKFKYLLTTKTPTTSEPYSIESSSKLIDIITATHTGLIVLEPNLKIQETSTNLGKISIINNTCLMDWYTRSFFPTGAKRVTRRIQALSILAGGTFKETNYGPSWTPIYLNNKLVELYKNSFKANYPYKQYKIQPTAGGLEAAIIIEKIPTLKYGICISPEIKDIHSSKERMNISSVKKFYNILIDIISNLKD